MIPSAAAVENERQRMEQDDELMPGGSLSLDNQEHLDELGTRISVENQDVLNDHVSGQTVGTVAEKNTKHDLQDRKRKQALEAALARKNSASQDR